MQPHVRLLTPYASRHTVPTSVRLWLARFDMPDVREFAARHGAPIRYGYVTEPWPLDSYQTVFAKVPGSAEMPSAGRAFTRALVYRLRRRGVRFAPVLLHTGVSSLDAGEPPYPERFHVPRRTATMMNDARASGHRVIAVGTTALRALETATASDGRVHAARGWTDLVITPERGVHVADALVTGWHAPGASHLAILEAMAGDAHVRRTYDAAADAGYLWHEFGDLHLLWRIPSSAYIRDPQDERGVGAGRPAMSISMNVIRRLNRRMVRRGSMIGRTGRQGRQRARHSAVRCSAQFKRESS